MKQKTRHIMSWLLGSMVIAGITACSGDDDTTVTKEKEIEPAENEVAVRRLTITEVKGAAAEAKQALTRATLAEDDGELTASWKTGDGLTYCNLMRTKHVMTPEEDDIPISGNLTATTAAATSQFTGYVACIKGDYLAVVYPATTFETNESYTISLAGQDGTLATLATNFHYVYGRAHVTSVTETTANATMEKMKSLLTVCKFSFVNKEGGAAIPIQTLTISYGGTGSDVGRYPQSATVAVIDEEDDSIIKAQADVHAKGVEGSIDALSISCPTAQEAVYVALLPTAEKRTFNFTVTNPSGTYTGWARAKLIEGKYEVATGLELTKDN